jgi:hypothetical protein
MGIIGEGRNALEREEEQIKTMQYFSTWKYA